ncbi:GH116 family glycosyl-hydrolase [Bacteroidota bacterium]
MKRLFKIQSISISILFSLTVSAQTTEWPVLKHYDQEHLSKIALPVGGIGTGTISLGGIGDLRDWEIVNRPAKGFCGTPQGNRAPFFAINVIQENQKSKTLALMGPIDISHYEEKQGESVNNHGLPRFRNCSFDTAYPFGQVNLDDPDIPVKVKVKAYNPLIPANADDSGIPVMILKYEVSNTSNVNLDVSVCGSFENFIGFDGSEVEKDWKGNYNPIGAQRNRNIFQVDGNLKGLFMYSHELDSLDEQWGTMAISTSNKDDVTYRTSQSTLGWNNDILELWDDFSDDGRLKDKPFSGSNTPRGSLAVKQTIEPGKIGTFNFYITWHFPNRVAWANARVGNYYTTQYENAWDVAVKTNKKLPELERKTIAFVSAFLGSDLPDVVKESALFNMSTLRTQTCFRTPDGLFFGWEGCNDVSGCCEGSCTHVWNYEQTTPFIFGDLAMNMRLVEFEHSTNNKGLMSFRTYLPIERAQVKNQAAADGQLGTIMKMYRDWQLSGDDDLLKKLWPDVKNATSFCWVEGGWDADQDGVMEGCQHNTMDVEYFGPNPQMQIWYLGALRAAEEMAKHIGDRKFAKKCNSLFLAGSEWTDKNLFNGEYYIQIIQPPEDGSLIAKGLTIGMGTRDYSNPAFQLGNGCLVDQLVGQYMAHICDLGYLVDQGHVKTTLKSIMRYNYKTSMHGHFNNMRSYVLGNESALLMASFPYDRPDAPFPYFSEAMTGFEYTAAVGMIYEGLTDEAMKVIKSVRDRYDGKKRSPFDEAECGHHYARAMAAYAEVLALTGFHYSAVDQIMKFKPIEGTYFWANGYTYGTIHQEKTNEGFQVKIKVLGEPLKLKNYEIRDFGIYKSKKTLIVASEGLLEIKITR